MPAARDDIPSTHLSLLGGVQGREVDAWSQFFRRYRPLVLRWCRQRGLDEAAAEDIAQTLMAEMPRKLAAYHPTSPRGEPQPFRSWLKTVVGRLVCDHERARSRRPGNYGAGGDEHLEAINRLTAADAETVAEDILAEYRADLERVIGSVRARLRDAATWAVFELLVLEDRPAADVAAAANKSLGSVYVAANRVKRLLADEYRALFPDSAPQPQGD